MSAAIFKESPPKKESVKETYFNINPKIMQRSSEESCDSEVPSPTPSATSTSSDESEVDGPSYRNTRHNPQPDRDVERIARELAREFISYKVKGNTKMSSDYAETLLRLGNEVDRRYDMSMNGIVRKLKFNPELDGFEAFTSSLNAMFEEGPVNWGRVIMVFVFGARLAKYCDENNHSDQVETLITYTGDYVANRLSGWIIKQGGWNNFRTNFRRTDWKEDLTFKFLVTAGASCGALALLRLITKS